MEKLFLKLLFIANLILLPFFSSINQADPPGPPGPGNNPSGSGGHSVGTNDPTGAPIGDGSCMLMTFATAYGLYKLYKHKKKGLKLKNEVEQF